MIGGGMGWTVAKERQQKFLAAKKRKVLAASRLLADLRANRCHVGSFPDGLWDGTNEGINKIFDPDYLELAEIGTDKKELAELIQRNLSRIKVGQLLVSIKNAGNIEDLDRMTLKLNELLKSTGQKTKEVIPELPEVRRRLARGRVTFLIDCSLGDLKTASGILKIVDGNWTDLVSESDRKRMAREFMAFMEKFSPKTECCVYPTEEELPL